AAIAHAAFAMSNRPRSQPTTAPIFMAGNNAAEPRLAQWANEVDSEWAASIIIPHRQSWSSPFDLNGLIYDAARGKKRLWRGESMITSNAVKSTIARRALSAGESGSKGFGSRWSLS